MLKWSYQLPYLIQPQGVHLLALFKLVLWLAKANPFLEAHASLVLALSVTPSVSCLLSSVCLSHFSRICRSFNIFFLFPIWQVVTSCHKLSKVVTSLQKSCHKLSVTSCLKLSRVFRSLVISCHKLSRFFRSHQKLLQAVIIGYHNLSQLQLWFLGFAWSQNVNINAALKDTM